MDVLTWTVDKFSRNYLERRARMSMLSRRGPLPACVMWLSKSSKGQGSASADHLSRYPIVDEAASLSSRGFREAHDVRVPAV